MNHFISGIIKIILLEGSIALLLMELVAQGRFEKERLRAHGVLAGVMVFAWCNYGALRHGTNVWWVLASIPVIVISGLLIARAFSAHVSTWFPLPPISKPLAVAAVVGLSGTWVSTGVAAGHLPLVHPWEQFHFYMGAKYQRELGWFNLYKAAIFADQETIGVLRGMSSTRELTTFEPVSVDVALQDAAKVRSRFSDAQWLSFKSDWVAMAKTWSINWHQVMSDHGNSNSPAWALLASPLAHWVPISAQGQALLGWLDMVLMLGLWLCIWQTFGHKAASVGLFIWAAPPIVFDYLAGSFLRWDWLFAVGLAACFLHRRRYGWAGGFFGFAVATKLFPIFFGVALGIRALIQAWPQKRLAREYWRFGIAAAVTAGAAVVISAGLFGVDAWKEYAQRIKVAQVEKFYAIQYSFRSVYLQWAATPAERWGEAIFPSDLAQRSPAVELCENHDTSSTDSTCRSELSACGDNHRFALDCRSDGQCSCSKDGMVQKTFVRELPCAQSTAERERLFQQECGFPVDYSFGFLVAKILFSLLIALLLFRADDVEAFLLGPLLVFTWLTVNMYYWNMLGLLALGLTLRAAKPAQRQSFVLLIGLHVIFMVFYLYQHLNRGLTEGYAVAWLLTVLVAGVSVSEGMALRRLYSDGNGGNHEHEPSSAQPSKGKTSP